MTRTTLKFLAALSLVAVGCAQQEPAKQAVAQQEQALLPDGGADSYEAGSIIIPMDTVTRFGSSQDDTTLRAFGLVYRLLRAGVQVDRIALPSKATSGASNQADDFTATTRNCPTGVCNSMTAGTSQTYRAGPFIVPNTASGGATGANRTLALANVGTFTDVNFHEATAAFTAHNQLSLRAAPRIAVMLDNNQDIAYAYLNGAGIPDSAGNTWSDTSPNVLDATEVTGPNATTVNDGALFLDGGATVGLVPAFDHLSVQHDGITIGDGIVREVRAWLDLSAVTHLHAQCSAIDAFENNTAAGRFLTTGGFATNNGPTVTAAAFAGGNLLNQYDLAFLLDSGQTDEFSVITGGGNNWKTGGTPAIDRHIELIRKSTSSGAGNLMVWTTGYLDSDPSNGFVTYLAGHNFINNGTFGNPDFLPSPPRISANGQLNGVRVYLDSLFTGGVNAPTAQPNISVTITAAPSGLTNGNSITYTIVVSNTGTGAANGVTLSDVIPTGSTFTSASNGGTNAAGTVSWNGANDLGTIVGGGSVTRTLVVAMPTDRTYVNNGATVTYSVGATTFTATSGTTTTTRDSTAPDTTLTNVAPAAGSTTNNRTPTFTFTSTEPGTFECSLDGAAFAACTTPLTTASLADGLHTFAVRAVDSAGNVDPTPASRTFTVDGTAPDTTITSGPAAGSTISSRTPSFAFNSAPDTSVRSFTCQMDSLPAVACGTGTDNTGTFTVALANALADGTHTFSVFATDPAGNADPSPATRTFTVDATAPDTTITSGPAAGSTTNSRTPTFAFDSPDTAVRTFTCQMDGLPAVSCGSGTNNTGTFTVAMANALSDGPHTFTVFATDPVGNADATPATRSFNIDGTAPDTTLTNVAPAQGSTTNNRTPTFTFTSTEPGTFECSLDGAAFAPCTTPLTTASLADGLHSFSVRAVDNAGNADQTPATRSFTVDGAAPDTTITSGPAAGSTINSRTPSFAFNAAPDTSVRSFTCQIDSLPAVSCGSGTDNTGSFTVAMANALADGPHTFSVFATDPAGNADPTPATRAFTVDTTAPDTTITSGPATGSTTNSRTPTFAFNSPDTAVRTFTCQMDGLPAVSCGSGTNNTGSFTVAMANALADGPHTFTVFATDPAGNADATPATRSFTVDATEPDTTLTNAAPAAGSTTSNRTPTFTFTSNDGSATFECSLDGAAFAACTTPLTTASLADGLHNFSVRAVDTVGNRDQTPATRSFTIDGTAPDTTITSGPAAGSTISSRTPSFGFSSGSTDTAVRTFTCQMDSLPAVSCGTGTDNTGTFTVALANALADGAHTFSVFATDPAGNVDPTPATRTFTVDGSAPDTTILTGVATGASTNDNTPTFTFQATAPDTGTATYECRVDMGTFAPCTSAFTTTTLVDGPHTFEVRAIDSAGNVDASPASRSFNVDTVAPNTTIDTGPADSSTITTGAPTFTFSSTETAVRTFTCRVDTVVGTVVTQGTPVSCGSGTAANGTFTPSPSLPNGTYVFNVFATDPAGNADLTPATRRFTVALTEPDTNITNALPANNATTNLTQPTFTFTSNDPQVRTFTCRFDTGTTMGTPVSCGNGTSAAGTFTTPMLTNGVTYTFSVFATNPMGTADSTPATRTFTVDTVAPDTTITSTVPADGGITNNPQPTFAFTSPDMTVRTFTCRIDSQATVACGSTSSASSTFTPSPGLSDGPHTFAVFATDPAGNADLTPAVRTFSVDATPPAAPAITAPANMAVINIQRPTISGTAEPLSTVRVFLDGSMTVLCTATANSSGAWTCPALTADIPMGMHALAADATDAAGNVSPRANSTFTIDLSAPTIPVIASPVNGSTINTARPTISGTAQANTTVRVFADGSTTALCTTTTNAQGMWTCPALTADLASGSHTLVATSTTASMNSSTSAPNTFTIDVTAPAAPIVIAPANGSTTGPSPTYTGTAEPSSTVRVFVDMATAAECTTTANAAGNFTCTGPTVLAAGMHTVRATATDAAGNLSPNSNTNSFTVSTSVPPGPPVIAVPAPNSHTSDTTPTVSGQAAPNSTVAVFIDGAPACSTTASSTGAWTCDVTTPLTPGAHVATATATTSAGTSGPSALDPFTVDTTAPAAPVITAPTQNATTSPTPTFAGTAPADATVRLFVDGSMTPSCTATADAQGRFACTATTALAAGAHRVSAVALDLAGNVSPSSNTVDFTVSTTAPPSAPVMTRPTPNSTINDTRPLLGGTATPNSTVAVSVDGMVVCTTTASASGTFQCQPTTPLSMGMHAATATATTANGTSPASAPDNFTVDTVAPARPTITSPMSNEVTPAQPTITGTAEPLSTVTVRIDGQVACETTAAANGQYSCVAGQPLAPGAHTVTANATDAAGNLSPSAGPVPFSVAGGVSAPVIVAPADGSTTSPSPTYTGTSDRGTTVKVFVDGSMTAECTAVTDAAGNFSCAGPTVLTAGMHRVSAIATDASNRNSPSSNTNNFTVVTTQPPGPPVITVPAINAHTTDTTPTISGQAAPNSMVAVFIDGVAACTATASSTGAFTCDATTPLTVGPHVATATATTAGGTSNPSALVPFTVDSNTLAAPVITAPTSGATTSPNPTFSGTAPANSTVQVFVDGAMTPACTATADSMGRFSCVATTALPAGMHQVVAKATNAGGAMSPNSPSVPFTVSTTAAPGAPVITKPTDGSFTTLTRPALGGTATPGSTVAVSVDGMVVCTTTASTAGTFECTPAMALSMGPHSVTATATTMTGTSPASSPAVNFTIDSVAPMRPTISSPMPNDTTPAQPAITGTAEAGSTVTVRVDGQVVCETTATSAGMYSCTPGQPLAAGPHTVTASATDAAGNRSPTAGPVPFTVGGAPAAPSITSPLSNATITTPRPTFSGTAEAGSTVKVLVDGTEVCSTTATTAGTFSCDAMMDLAAGMHSVTATATNPQGTSGMSTAVPFTVSMGMAPMAPVITGPAKDALLKDNKPTFTGTAPPGSTVKVLVDGAEVCTATADAQGAFSCTATAPLMDGPHNVTARATNSSGTSTPSMAVPFTVDTKAPGAPTITSPTPGSTTKPTTTFTGTAEPGSTVQVTVDGMPICTATTDSSGNFSCDTDKPLSAGPHSVIATAGDAAGNVSAGSTPVDFNVAAKTQWAGGGCNSTEAAPILLAALAAMLSRRRRRS